MKLARYLSAVALLGGSHIGLSQSYLGLSSMNYSGVHRLYLNPANAAGRTNPVSISLFGVGQTYDNTYADWEGENNILSAIIDREINSDDLEPRNNTSNLAGVGVEARALGATFGIGSYVGIGISSRVRGDLQFRDTSLDLLEAMRLGVNADRWEENQLYTNQTLTFNTNSYGEVALTLAGRPPIMGQGDEHRFYVGASVKYLQAVAASSLFIEDMSYEIVQNPQQPGERLMHIRSIRGTMGYSTPDADEFDIENPLESPAGRGFGADLGVIYERKGNLPGQKYKYRFGVSVMDIGNITYDEESTEFYTFGAEDIEFTADEVDEFAEDPYEVIRRKTGAKVAGTSYTAYLPTTLILQADYSILPILYLGGIYSRRINEEPFGIDRGNFAALIPRLELKWLSLALPVTYKNDFEQLALGTTLRLGPLYVGADNWLGAVSEKNIARMQAYMGFAFNIGAPL